LASAGVLAERAYDNDRYCSHKHVINPAVVTVDHGESVAFMG